MFRGIDPKNLKTKTDAEGPKNERKNHQKKNKGRHQEGKKGYWLGCTVTTFRTPQRAQAARGIYYSYSKPGVGTFLFP